MIINYDTNGLVPAIIQDANSREVLMLGYMNAEAVAQTKVTNKVTFYSRSKQRLWTKGEESGNFLALISIKNDCDNDALLIQAEPQGPTCHNGTLSCWGNSERTNFEQIEKLEAVIQNRKEVPNPQSYVSDLFQKGMNKIAQKVGEEAVEVVIEAKDDNPSLFLSESADLLFHYLILLQAKGFKIADVLTVLKSREQ